MVDVDVCSRGGDDYIMCEGLHVECIKDGRADVYEEKRKEAKR